MHIVTHIADLSIPFFEKCFQIVNFLLTTHRSDCYNQNMSYGQRIKEARKNKKLTQKQLGDLLGVSKSTISSYEKCNREPNVENIRALASLLDVNADYILDVQSDCCVVADAEMTLIQAYRARPEMQSVINKLLDIETPENHNTKEKKR